MPKRAVFERSRRELSLDVSVGVHILLVVEQSNLESQSRGCAKTPILTVYTHGRNVNVQYSGGFLPDIIILLTQCYLHRGTCLNAMKRFCICSL